ncbi:PREDICTED: protein CHUP1, chloroplastic [Ipomoea nil]|uniref:protein CHUP1, chloroplastic n=1 Tax=Ipomoea nil TaxID=35883 RepID=UPI000901B8F6|nr:PREDICTED: protein CHUP1, chloroplastic [Ipomoea nil]
MESTSSKMEAMKPVLLKAGIPLAVTVAGFIIARITQRKGSFSQASSLQSHKNSPENEPAGTCRDEGGLPGLDSETLSCPESGKNTGKLQEEIISSKGQIKDSQGRERELETRSDYYNFLKEQENRSLMEITKIEILEREISALQGESQRFEKMVAEYLKIIELLECSRSENVLLHRRVKRLQKKTKHLSHAVNPKNLQLKAKEAEISRNQAELRNKDDTINKIEEDFRQVKMALEKLQHERDELLRKADSYKNDAEMVSMDDYKELVHELEKLHESKAAEEKELVYLRWCNACLRHELTRTNQEDENQSEVNNNGEDSGEIADFASDNELRSSSVGQHESCLGFPIGGHSHDHSKRKKLVQKFKKWSEKMKHKLDEKEKHHTNSSANHSYSSTAGDLILPARNSFSSA